MSEPAESHDDAEETAETSGLGNLPRGGDGRFRRSVETAERDARAAALASTGWTYEEIATELRFANRGAAYKAAQRAMIATALGDGSTEELRRTQLEELRLLRRYMCDRIENPLPAISRTGKIVTGADGKPVPDATALAAAAAIILKANERVSKLRGTEAPKRTMSASATLDSTSAADFSAHVEAKRREYAAEIAANIDDLPADYLDGLEPEIRVAVERLLTGRPAARARLIGGVT